MKKHFLIALAIMPGLLAIQSCDNKGCTDPNASNFDADADTDDGSCQYGSTNLGFHIHSKLGSSAFAFNQEATNWEGRKVKFTLASMYISGVKLHDDAGHTAVDNSYMLVVPGTMEYSVGSVTSGHYHGVMFTIGVDSVANHADPASWPASHPLSSNNQNFAHWGWDTGYIFVKVEGLVDTTAAMNGVPDAPFAFHIGLDGYKVNVDLDKHMDINSTSNEVMLNLDWLKLLNNIDMRMNRVTHTMDNMMLANQVKTNMGSVFSVE